MHAAVRVLHNLLLGRTALWTEVGREDVGRMVADGQQGGEEGLARGGVTVEHLQGIGEEVVVLHAPAADQLVGRIVLLRVDFLVAVGAEEGVHVVVLRLVRHEEHRVVAVVTQDGGQTRIGGDDRAFHRVALHHRREGIERGIQSVVRVVAGGVEVGERERMTVEAVEAGRQLRLLAEALHQAGGHRLHEHQHHVAARRHRVGLYDPGKGRDALDARPPEVGAGTVYGLLAVHEVQRPVLRTQVVDHARHEVERRVQTHLVEHGVQAEVGCTHLDGVIAHASADAEEAQSDETGRDQQDAAALPPGDVRLGQVTP